MPEELEEPSVTEENVPSASSVVKPGAQEEIEPEKSIPRKKIAPRKRAASHKQMRPGDTMPLMSLAPNHDPDQHRVYLDLLERALLDSDTRSVALTGAYGSGKSSVLRELGVRWRGRRWWIGNQWWRRSAILELSLSTLDPDHAPAVPSDNPAENEVSNRIQKELVKQLLYQLPSWKTPRSRFPRASKPWPLNGVLVAGAAATAVGLAWVATSLLGWQPIITDRLSDIGWSAAVFWGGATTGTVLAALALWKILAGRYAVRGGLKTGALTVSLEPTSSSYFDQYLDEIMYFFQVSKTGVVLIEDVDRFSDATVFDTLRALNALVNSSGQVRRRVVFVYAIRDSVLGKIGSKNPMNGEQKTHEVSDSEVERSNRAKHFDVIIPMVPFVTTHNARDLMMQVMHPHVETATTPGISPGLIRLAARRVADMRTLWSIRNEFEIHLDRLVTSANKQMPKINYDIILSLVLLRATTPAAYEDIRLTTSPLDTLTTRWLELVKENLGTLTTTLTSLRKQLEDGESRISRAEIAGHRLELLRPELRTFASLSTPGTVSFQGPLTDGDLAEEDGWQRIAAGEAQTVAVKDSMGYTRADIQLSAEILTRLVGMPIDPETWHVEDLEDMEGEIRRVETQISFLRHHEWEQLYARTDLTVAATEDETTAVTMKGGTVVDGQLTFGQLVSVYAPSPLAHDLIKHGYLPRHFARYSSVFYGHVIKLEAAEYIARAIEPGVPIRDSALDDRAVSQILSEQDATTDGGDLFDDPSIYNLDIISYLIEHRRGAAHRVATNLATRWGEVEREFVDMFFQRKEQETAAELARLMAPSWPQALHHTIVVAPVTNETRLRLVNAVLGAIALGSQSDVDGKVARYLSEHYAELANVTEPPDRARAAIVMETIAEAGATLQDLTPLSPDALAAAFQVSIYPVTARNLEVLKGLSGIALDEVRSQSGLRPVYDHLLAHLDDYLDALPLIHSSVTPVVDPGEFISVLNNIAATPHATLLQRFVDATSTDCRISDINGVQPTTWVALINCRRADPTFKNVESYINKFELDDTIGAFLSECTTITTPEEIPQPARVALAVEILEASESIPSPATRVEIVESMSVDPLSIDDITLSSASLIGRLLTARILADEPATFNPDLLGEWEDFEAAVAASLKFRTFLDATTIPAQYLVQTLNSGLISSTTKLAVVNKLQDLLIGVSPSDATEIAKILTDQYKSVGSIPMLALAALGASTRSMVGLLASEIERLSVDDIKEVLGQMRGDYTALSQGGSGVVRFPVDPEHQKIVDRLAGVTHGGAKEKTTKKYGKQLEMWLKKI